MYRGGGRRRQAAAYPASPVVSYISITSVSPPTFQPPDTFTLTGFVESSPLPVAGQSVQRRPCPGRTVTFTSGNVLVATVGASAVTDAGGAFSVTVTAVGDGTTTITPTCEGVTDQTQSVTVTTPQNPVASVEWTSPGDFSVTIGGNTTRQARAKDAGGNVLTGKTITWSTTDSGLATVSADSGDENHQVTITGVAAGTPSIKATCDGVDSTSYVATVSAGGGGGGTQLWVNNFDAGSLTGSVGGALAPWSNSGSGPVPSIVDDATASGGKCFSVEWVVNGTSDNNKGGRLSFSQQSKVHIRFRHKISVATVGHITKVIRFIGSSEKLIGTMDMAWLSGVGHRWYHWGDDFGLSPGQAGPNNPDDTVGSWVWHELMLDHSVAGQYTWKHWFNDTLILNFTRTGVGIGTTYTGGIRAIYLAGIQNGTVQARTDLYDEVVVATDYIGLP